MGWRHHKPLILASKSQARQRLLREAGLDFVSCPASVDERALNARHEQSPITDQAMILARAKALTVSDQYPDHWVIGSDQMLDCEGQMFHQIGNKTDALTQLQALNGRRHRLTSTLCLAFAGQVEAEIHDEAFLSMKHWSTSELESYLDEVGEQVFGSVGCYHIEAEGARLFERIEGSRSTIMGMPFEPLLELLHQKGLIAA